MKNIVHRYSFILILMFLLCAKPSYPLSMEFTGPNRSELTEGKTYQVSWTSSGGETVNIIARGERTPLGNISRGRFDIILASRTPAVQGTASIKLPWIDAANFFLVIKEYDGSGHLVASNKREYGFRPALLDNRLKDGIYIDLHQRKNQRLYVEKDGLIKHVYACSSSENYHWLPRNKHISPPHDHAGVFKVLEKNPSHWSELYGVRMLWSMRYLGGHFIHATTPNLYKMLGRPSSHGCNRLTRQDAKVLYDSTPVATRVEVIGLSQ